MCANSRGDLAINTLTKITCQVIISNYLASNLLKREIGNCVKVRICSQGVWKASGKELHNARKDQFSINIIIY